MRRPAALLLLALLAGCREGRSVRLTADSAAAGISVDPQTVPGRIALELWSLRPAVALGTWAATNLNDIVTPADSQRIAQAFGDWCAVSTRVSEMQDRFVVRQAFFYAPEPPADRALPDAPSADLARDCVLGLVWIRVPVRDSAAGAPLADSVRAQLAGIFAPDTTPVTFWGSAFWAREGRFRRGEVEAVSALRTAPPAAMPGDSSRRPHDVIALARLPSSGVPLGPEVSPGAVAFVVPDSIGLDSAVRLSGLDTSLAGALLRLVAVAESGLARPDWRPPPGDTLVRSLRRWLTASAALPPPRRAAALYAADLVLDRAMCAFPLCQPGDSAALAPLRALGADIGFVQLGGSWLYRRSWLAQARALDRDSPLGRQILLEQMANAFDFSGVCEGGAEGFRRVIDNGTRYLERVPDSPVRAAVHFYVAEAWRDIAALAGGAADIYADSSAYGPQLDSARTQALAHYRAAIAVHPAGPVAAAAWRQAWWLLAGLRLRGTRFYCIYD